ncbi:MAG: hypothetical protein DMH00_01855 [Acidobacteria bacterium]|nr:MAG: hypothetical protein DMH00_01855 [Acidobacteriota bacterium]
MRWSFHRGISLALSAALLVPAFAPTALPTWRIVAGPECLKGEPRTDSASTLSAGVSFSARPLGVAEYEARLERRSPGMGGLFRGPSGKAPPFQVFLVSLENRNKDVVRFQPGNVLRIGGPHEQDHILDYTDLYRYLQDIGKGGESLDPLRDEFFDSGMSLDTGHPVVRLLFFRELPPSKKRKAMMLLFSSFQVGAETYQAGLAWHFEKVK